VVKNTIRSCGTERFATRDFVGRSPFVRLLERPPCAHLLHFGGQLNRGPWTVRRDAAHRHTAPSDPGFIHYHNVLRGLRAVPIQYQKSNAVAVFVADSHTSEPTLLHHITNRDSASSATSGRFVNLSQNVCEAQ
jgi:hypothetical protein